MTFQGWDNPVGTDGFEFIEYTAPDPVALGKLFEQMGFTAIARHRHKNVTLYRQGEINFIINAEPDSFAQRFARQHGPSICAIAFRVADAGQAYERALELGAWGFDNKTGPMELNIPAIKGIGDSLIYFVDRWRGKNGAQPGGIGDISIYDVDFEPIPGAESESGRPRPDLHRSPDAQRASRPHDRMGRVLRAAVQLPRSALLRYRRQGDGGEVEGDDVRPAARSAFRSTRKARRRPARSRNISTRITAKASSTSRSARTTSTARSTACATRKSRCSTPSTPITNWSTGACRTTANRWRN